MKSENEYEIELEEKNKRTMEKHKRIKKVLEERVKECILTEREILDILNSME